MLTMRGTRGAWGLAALVLALVAMPGSAGAATTPTRYSLAHGCYSLSGVAAAQQVRMQPTALGRYLLYRPDRTFAASQKDGSVAAATDPSPAADWKVDEAGEGGGGRGRAIRSHAAVRGPRLDGRPLRARERLRRLPGGRPRRHRHARQGRDGVREGRRPGRGTHALDDVRVPRRQFPLRQAVGPVRDPVRAARLLLDRGSAGLCR